MTRHPSILLCAGLMTGAAAVAADRTITVAPMQATSWEFVTPGTQVIPRRPLAVGFWQRASGAKPGVGAVYASSMEYQLPEAAPQRVRSASFQFSGHASQCAGGEPVVIEVRAYAADGRADVADASAGSAVAQMSADCTDRNAFARPIDVTAIVRQLSVAAGIRHVGFNVRKANNRQGPGLFALNAGKLSIVLADTALAMPAAPLARAPGAAPAAPMTAGVAIVPAAAALPPAAPPAMRLPALAAARPAPAPQPQPHSASAVRAALQKNRPTADR